MTTSITPKNRINPFLADGLFLSLNEEMQLFIEEISNHHRLTYQQTRQTIDMAIDFSMWDEEYKEIWIESEVGISGKKVFQNVRNAWHSLKQNATEYQGQIKRPKGEIRKVASHSDQNEILGMCPVASEKTVCCNLMTVDAAQGCGLGCSYCSIQTFYEDGAILVDSNLREKLDSIQLDVSKNYHIGSGQSSDSLAVGNKNGIIDAQLDFARKNPNIIFEFKTKTKNISSLLDVDVPENVFVCWSLNPDEIIDHEEHGTARLNQRISSARLLADKGIIVGFHFHPLFYYQGWEKGYKGIVDIILSTFLPEEIGMISFGTLTYIKPAIKRMRVAGFKSKALQMPLVEAAGKYSYPMEIKEKIFGKVFSYFASWHEHVFFYFCMEDKQLWKSVFGSYYKSNDLFEDALFRSVKNKMIHRRIV
ncbi:MAG: hypothetical protein ISR83_04540 [Candidatus Marinimicrobia bacterium]|nr:hypothetical protein [Candidatus Neomarinimicrobiota bacterium]